MKLVVKNPNAYRNYDIQEKIEAGIVLSGTEIKSIRNGGLSLRDSYVIIRKGEIILLNAYIAPYKFGNRNNEEPTRDRKLLLHKKEIEKLDMQVKTEKVSIVPIRAYFSNNYLKLELGIGKGKKLYDKRKDIAEKDAKRNIERAIKNKYL